MAQSAQGCSSEDFACLEAEGRDTQAVKEDYKTPRTSASLIELRKGNCVTSKNKEEILDDLEWPYAFEGHTL
eukprot:763745-Amphidinium_carterae.1